MTSSSNLSRRSSLIDYFSSLPVRSRLPSIRSRKSTASSTNNYSGYTPYAVHQQTMFPVILKDADATAKLLEYILESPNGRRSLSRLARTCKAFKEPALNVLWRDLDSFVPLLALFPNSLLRRARRPGLGLAKNPEATDWDRVLANGERVRSIAYVEAYNNVSPSIFPVFEEFRPRDYILPNLTSLTWKAETSAGLERSMPFITPGLQSLTIEMGAKYPKMGEFLEKVVSKTQLSSFSFTLHSNMPDNFVEILQPNRGLEKLSLMAPGALSAKVGKWTACLPYLKSFALDLSNRTTTAVEGFFDEINPGSGCSTPSSVGGTDSGVFSGGEEFDFSSIRKSAMKITGDGGPPRGAFKHLTQISLIGDTSNIATFLKHITSPLVTIDLSIEDPPAKEDWQDLCNLVSDQFSDTLQYLRIGATSTSRFNELVRSTSRGGEVQLKHLPLEHFAFLPQLVRLEIDLPESAVFHHRDISHLARVCPSLEVLRLCGLAKFPTSFGSPFLTLEGIVPLTTECKRLHTLAIVVNAIEGREETFRNLEASSRSLLRLHVGHSWIKDPLQTAVLLSHLAPHLENIKWLSQPARAGTVEANAAAWQKVSEYLPSLQNIRRIERSLMPKQEIYVPPPKAEKAVDATVVTSECGVSASPAYSDGSVQAMPSLVTVGVEAMAETSSVEVDATPELVDESILATPSFTETEVDARPDVDEKGIEAAPSEDQIEESDVSSPHISLPPMFSTVMPSITGLVNFPIRVVRVYTYYLSLPLRYMLSFTPNMSMLSGTSTTYAHDDPSHESKTPVPGSLEDVSNGTEGSLSEKSMPSTMHAPPPHNATADILADSDTLVFDNASVFAFLPESRKPKRLPKSAPLARHVKKSAHDHNATRQSKLKPAEPHSSFTRTIPYTRYYDMADVKKQEKDYTKEVDALLPETKTLAESGKLQEALDKLFVLEKHARNASDLPSTTRLVKEIIQLCYDARDYALLNSSIHTLSKKHGQLKVAIQTMVELAMGWLEEIKEREGTEKWLQLVESLRTVTEGKLFLETPRARVTLLLSKYYEILSQTPTPAAPSPKESLQTASDLLSDLQVETYSSMERREKTEFILEQMRLLIALAKVKDSEKDVEGKKDAVSGGEQEWIKVRVGGRKVNEGFLALPENEDLKLKYYEMMIQYALHESSYLDAAKYYHKVWEAPSIKQDEKGRARETLEHIVYYIVLAPHDNEQSDMLHRLFHDPALAKLELHYALVKCFTTPELMRWPGIESIYGPHLRKTTIFSSDKLWEDLHTRVIEHNIRIVAKYYTRIKLQRLTTLLDLSPQQTEETLCRLVVSGTVWARIDRPSGIVNFRSSRSAEDVMNDWSSDMQRLLSLVEKTWMGVNAAQAAQARVKA
ncbi:unnamed protein product [Somion occarium]|uniref:PCI domain-containing protein n=1 Tax=Somion occarium TaxID=3059160 RepID=A0ABP1CKH1_9APHY